MKKLIALSMIATFTLPTLAFANENERITTILDIDTVQSTIPSRFIADEFGYDVTWNEQTKQVTFKNEMKKVIATADSSEYIVNGENITLATPMTIRDGVSYIPFNLVEVLKPSGYEIKDKELAQIIATTVQDKQFELLEEQLKANEEYKEAYLSTGGDLDDYREPVVQIGADVISADADYVSVMVYRFQALASSYTEEIYYTFDAKTGELCSLETFFGENYENYVKNSVVSQMAKIEAEDPNSDFYFETAVDDVVIDENTNFYINGDGEVVVVFPKYALAAGVYGKQQFVIPAMAQ